MKNTLGMFCFCSVVAGLAPSDAFLAVASAASRGADDDDRPSLCAPEAVPPPEAAPLLSAVPSPAMSERVTAEEQPR